VKFAFSTLACPRWSIEQVVENAVQMGYDGIELRLLDGEIIDPARDAEKVIEAVSLSRASGIDVCAFDSSCRFNLSDPLARAQNVADLERWIRLARQLQVPIVRVFGGERDANAQQTEEQENAWVVEALRQVAPLAEQAGVTVVLETHDAFSSARRVARVLDAVHSSAVAALWDSHHPYRVGESVDDVINVLGKHIAHVHVKDAFRIPDSDHWQLVLLGEGEVPVQEQLVRLQQHGYRGYVSVEWEKRWHLELSDPEIALPEHIAWLKRLDQALPAV